MPVIAIVDDDDSFRRATMSFVRSLGYAVLQFASAEAFLKSDQLHDADCLISDAALYVFGDGEIPPRTGRPGSRRLRLRSPGRAAQDHNAGSVAGSRINRRRCLGSLRGGWA